MLTSEMILPIEEIVEEARVASRGRSQPSIRPTEAILAVQEERAALGPLTGRVVLLAGMPGVALTAEDAEQASHYMRANLRQQGPTIGISDVTVQSLSPKQALETANRDGWHFMPHIVSEEDPQVEGAALLVSAAERRDLFQINLSVDPNTPGGIPPEQVALAAARYVAALPGKAIARARIHDSSTLIAA